MKNIEYKINQSNNYNILSHLEKCDKDFIPELSTKVNLKAYSNKIFENAIRIEAWIDNSLIGLIAVYQNNLKEEMFITNVSIEKKYTGNGIADALMNELIVLFHSQKINKIKLEVDANNAKALNLYKKYNFKLESYNENTLTLKLKK